nr:hypothetical protein Q903MT_gene6274 [Picea sitchensis]
MRLANARIIYICFERESKGLRPRDRAYGFPTGRVLFIAVGNLGVYCDRLIGIRLMGPGLDSLGFLASPISGGGGTRKGVS